MSQEIFISYRRKDTGGYAGRLYDHLKQEYGPEGVLFDVEVDATAEQLRGWVQRVVPEASVVLVLIGDQWVEDRYQRRRLEEPDDIVRLEIELALSNDIPIIPVLVDGALIPSASDLPKSIRGLVSYKGYEINNSYWESKFQLILGAVSSVTRIHTPIIKRGVKAWNSWRSNNESVTPNLAGARLTGKELGGIDLSSADLHGADLSKANLSDANLRLANFTDATLRLANLENVLAEGTKFLGTDLTEVNLKNAFLNQADLSHANLNGAVLTGASLVECQVFGVSVWNTLLGDTALQKQLHVGDATTGDGFIADSIQMAVIIHLLLTSGGVREVFGTINSNLVLILGRFARARKVVLDVLWGELSKCNYMPLFFDLDRPERDLQEAVTALAHMSRFAIADITDTGRTLLELCYVASNLSSAPVAIIYESTTSLPVTLDDELSRYQWVLTPRPYNNAAELSTMIADHVIASAETKIREMGGKR